MVVTVTVNVNMTIVFKAKKTVVRQIAGAVCPAILLAVCSCANSVAKSTKTAPPTADGLSAEAVTERQTIVRLADETLTLIAAGQYGRLSELMKNARSPLDGHNIAKILLNAQLGTVTIERWDAQKIDVELRQNGRTAVASANVKYRPRPNRPGEWVVFKIPFEKDATDRKWYLKLPQTTQY